MLDVEFGGERSGEAPLTWAQYGMWAAMRRNPTSHFTIPLILVLPEGAAAEVRGVADAVGSLISRHEALRTTVRDLDGEPRQVLARSGRIAVRVVETTTDDVSRTAQELRAADRTRNFRRDIDLPLRTTLIVAAGLVRQVLLVFDHLAVDLAGAEVVVEDLRSLLTGGPLAPSGLQPIDLARREQQSGADLTARAVRNAVEQWRRIPLRMFPPVGPPEQPRTQVVTMDSAALVTAGDTLARRHRTSLSTVLLAATAVLVGAWTGHTTAAVTVIAGNRYRPGFRRMVTNLQKPSLFVLELPDGAVFDEVLRVAHVSALRTYRHAYYDQVVMDRAHAEVSAERGTEINPFCCVNFADRTADRAEPGQRPAAVSERGLRELQSTTVIRPQPDPSQVRCHFCMRFRTTHSGFQAVLSANTDHLPQRQIGRFLTVLEEYLVASVFGKVSIGELRGWP